ncbi:MAG: phosphoribosylanthranilate isomerase [Candidatus Omnitrophota bacterium]|jgi:phosphoribosylanthranilate isomerase
MNFRDVKIKICGITNYEDAKMAIDLGADALGFIFANSPRRISATKAKSIIEKLPPFIDKVGVFVDKNPKAIQEIARAANLTTVQFSGEEDLTLIKRVRGLTKIKAIRMTPDFRPSHIKDYPVNAYLLETPSETMMGGTGKVWDWSSVNIEKIKLPVIIAGGLNPDNIEACIKVIRPYGVDVCSGVEKEPGKKDYQKVKRFIENAKIKTE